MRLALAGVAPIPWALDSLDALEAAEPLPGNAYKVELAQASGAGRSRRSPASIPALVARRLAPPRHRARWPAAAGSQRWSRSRSSPAAAAAATTTTSSQSAPGCTAVEAPEPREPESRQARSASSIPKSADRRRSRRTAAVHDHARPERSPNTAASFAALAEDGYFDDTIFHRIVPGFVIQGGDPTATGTRRPRLHDRRHARGGHAVHDGRRRDGEDAGRAARRAGSQFFVVTADELPLRPTTP